MTVREIAETNHMTISQIRGRIYGLNLKKVNKDKKYAQYSSSQIESILSRKGVPVKAKRSLYTAMERKKILIIEYHLKFPELSVHVLSSLLNLNLEFTQETVMDWRSDDNCLTLESKMNRHE